MKAENLKRSEGALFVECIKHFLINLKVNLFNLTKFLRVWNFAWKVRCMHGELTPDNEREK